MNYLKNLCKVSYETVLQSYKNSTWSEILIVLILISACFPLRYLFDSDLSYATGAYSDFTSYSIYLSDFLLIVLLVVNLKSFTRNKILILSTWIAGLLFTTLFYQLDYVGISLYAGLKLTILIALSLSVRNLSFKFLTKVVPNLVIILAVIQSGLALGQFLTQSSLGLQILGESLLSLTNTGVAKVVAHGTQFIRGYGTFPHPNVLSAFLIIGFIWNIYYLYNNSHKYKLFYVVSLIFTTWGLTVAFSRSAWIATVVVLGLIISRDILVKNTKRIHYHVVFAILTIVLPTLIILSPFVASRYSANDGSYQERQRINNIGYEMIKQTFPFGTGISKSVLNMQSFSENQLKYWQFQPIHNFFLITIAEIGVLSIMLFYFIFKPVFNLVKQYKSKFHNNDKTFYLLTIFAGLTCLMLFDHYFFTIEQSKLILWVFVIIAYNYAGFHEEKYDTTYDTLSQK